MGFSSGVPLLLTGSILKTLLTEAKIDLSTIGLFSLVGIPYTLKFLWAPVIDRFSILGMGRRRGWLIVSQIGLVISIVAISFVNPNTDLMLLVGCAVLISFLSASQDIVVDAYRREVLSDEELGLASSIYTSAYYFALYVVNFSALFLADRIPWRETYWAMASLMIVGILATIFCAEPEIKELPPRTLRESVVGPFQEFFRRDGALVILAFVLLYKIGQQLSSEMLNPFYIQLGFTKTQMAVVAKSAGFWFMLAGNFVGGVLILRLKIYRSLWVFGILQAVALVMFSILAQVGPNIYMLGVAVGTEYFTSGMATIAYVAFMASQTNRRFSGTQYALLSSLMGIPRTIVASGSGFLAAFLGWPNYFIACIVFTIPGLLLLFVIKKFIGQEQPS